MDLNDWKQREAELEARWLDIEPHRRHERIDEALSTATETFLKSLEFQEKERKTSA
jgi:hypothetical protein